MRTRPTNSARSRTLLLCLLLLVTPTLVACPDDAEEPVTGTILERTPRGTGVTLKIQRPNGRTRNYDFKTSQLRCTVGALYPDCVEPELHR